MAATGERPLDAAALLGPGGAVARALPGFRVRAEQQAMAATVEEAIEKGRHLVVEAGTGVGKSFGYLVPALLSVDAGGGPVVVATRTIALQEQLVGKDIPFLQRALDLDVSVALAKGRGQYVCLRRLQMAQGEASTLFASPEPAEQLAKLWEWAQKSRDGSLSDAPFRPAPEVWDVARAEQGNCLHQRCAFYDACGYQRSRRALRNADLIVANHALVLTDLALRQRGAAFLPEYETLVVDEAHELEEGAAEHFGIRVSELQLTRQLARLAGARGRGGLFDRVNAPAELYQAVEEVREAARELFDSAGRLRGTAGERRIEAPGAFHDPLTRPLAAAVRLLRRHQARIEDPGALSEWKSRADRLEEIGQAVEAVHGLADPELVYWAESAGRAGRTALRAAPVEVATTLRRALFERTRCVVLTSATLRVGNDFSHCRARIGLDDATELGLGSPFDYERQCKLVLFPRMPDPRSPDYDGEVARRAKDLVLESGGGAFVLFTSYRALERACENARADLERAGLTVLRQGADLRHKDIVEAFARRPDCVLFATDTFWQGIDVRGDNLRLVVLARLPFAVPDHPLQQARIERVEANGGDAFRELSLPQAVLKLRQGFGRLIRTHEDAGAVAILDPRVCTKRYGRVFLDSLPKAKVEYRE